MNEPVELNIVVETTYQVRRGEWTATVRLLSVPEEAKYGVGGNDALYTASRIKEVVSKIILRENEVLSLFAQNDEGRRGTVAVDVSRHWPHNRYADTTRVSRGLIKIKLE